MSKFKKGDKVASVKTGAKGVVDEVYGEEKYAVLFDGAANPDRVEGFQIRLANSRACNAKFKIGEWVEFNSPGIGKRLGSVDEIKGDEYYIEDPKLGVTHIVKEKDIMRTVVPVSQTWGNAESPVSTNSVVRNAMAANARAKNAQFNVGDKVVCTTGIYKGVKGTITEIKSGSDMVRVKEDKYGQEPFWDAKDIKLANSCDTASNAKYNHEHAPEVMRFLKASLDNLKKASSYVAFAEEMSPVASAIHSVEEAIRKLQ